MYFLKRKFNAFDVFKEFKVFIEKQNGYQLKVLRSGRGGEYTFDLFECYCKENRIMHEVTPSYMS